ncbi:hypothetical protein ACTXQV_78150, partial [Klebsiella pneumoniae]
ASPMISSVISSVSLLFITVSMHATLFLNRRTGIQVSSRFVEAIAPHLLLRRCNRRRSMTLFLASKQQTN